MVIIIFSTYRKGAHTGLEILVLKIIQNSVSGITGYEIIQEITSNPRGLWRGTAGSIYPLLKNLADEDLVRIEEIHDGKRVKKEYSITEKGANALKEALSKYIYPSMRSFMDSIFTLIGDLPRVKKNVETMFCSFPHHRHMEVDEEDLSIENQRHIRNVIKRLTSSRDEFNHRIKLIDDQIIRYRDILENIEKSRKEKSKPIEIFDDDYYS
ncbi:MAG: helix-turn-helix transcriptional regulator [Candidatus Lokiarchaeota archaeon]|nr:helix-turn-helix transcriptional regulator [Candidatus Lokiarchaeota archaeon]